MLDGISARESREQSGGVGRKNESVVMSRGVGGRELQEVRKGKQLGH